MRDSIRCIGVGFALALLFAGIWTADAQMLPALALPTAGLWMRIISFVLYALFFAAIWRSRRRFRASGEAHVNVARKAYDKRALTVLAIIALICSVAGVVLFLMTGETGSSLVSESVALSALDLVLLKVIGLPASIVVALALADLSREHVVQTVSVGMIGAFIGRELLMAPQAQGRIASPTTFLIGSALIVIALIMGAYLLLHPGLPEGEKAPQRVVTRPIGHVFTPYLVLCLVGASVFLGYLRPFYNASDFTLSAVIIVVLVVMSIIVLIKQTIDASIVMRAAILCATASVLMDPVFSQVSFNPSGLLEGVGSSLFEVAAWILVVAAVRNCEDRLLAAAGARLLGVTGHMLGGAVALGALLLEPLFGGAREAGGLLLVFACIAGLLYFMNDSSGERGLIEAEGEMAANEKATGKKAARKASARAVAADDSAPGEKTGSQAAPSEMVPGEKAGSQVENAVLPVVAIDASAIGGKNAATVDVAQPAVAAAASAPISPAPLDEHAYWDAPCHYLASIYTLTPRECDVLEQLARGRNLSYMAELFVLSQNTLKMHVKHIYQKLEVHSKQETIDLVDSVRERLASGVLDGDAVSEASRRTA